MHCARPGPEHAHAHRLENVTAYEPGLVVPTSKLGHADSVDDISVLPGAATSNGKARASLSDRLNSTEMLGQILSCLALSGLSVYLGHRLGVLPTLNVRDWLSYFGLTTPRKGKDSRQRQFAACNAAAVAGKRSWDGVHMHPSLRACAATQDECALHPTTKTASEGHAQRGGHAADSDVQGPRPTLAHKAYSYYLRDEQRAQFQYQEGLRSEQGLHSRESHSQLRR